jgi:hypothetical protein
MTGIHAGRGLCAYHIGPNSPGDLAAGYGGRGHRVLNEPATSGRFALARATGPGRR